MLMTPAEIQEKFKLDDGYIWSALLHEKCPSHIVGDSFNGVYKFEEADVVEALRSYYKHQERLALDTLYMWRERSDRFEATLVELG